MARSDERPLWQAFKERGDLQAREQLILAHLYLVAGTRERVVPAVPVRIDPADLQAEGLIGLIEAVDRFEPARGTKFTSFAISKIRGKLLEYLRKEDWTPRSERDRQKRGEPAVLLQQVSLETIVYEGDTEDVTLLNRISDWEDTPEKLVPEKLEREVIHTLVRCLPRRERKVVELYYWDDQTNGRIAQRLGLSEARVHQIHDTALFHLKLWLVNRRENYAGW
jgi:RNA polymerase sigma factor FliA